jgi:hypothetical protein
MAMNGISSESGRVRSWAEDAPAVVDLTQPEQDEWTRRVADEMLELFPGAGDLLRRFIPQLSPIIDTQCGFKAFRASVADATLMDTIEKRFAFDIELLLRTELASPGSIVRVPIAWIDSEAASTTKELQPYLPMLQSIVRIARRYLPPNERVTAYAELIDSLDEESWGRLVDDVPAEIAGREAAELEAYDGVTADALRAVARGLTGG